MLPIDEFLFMFIYTFFFLKIRILNPLSSLSQYIQKYEEGEKNFSIDVVSDDEIGSVIKEFRHMKNTLNEKYDLIERVSITDELTGTYNRKYYNKKMLELLEIYKRYETKFSILLYDIDDFKLINDNYGHAVGDKVLVKMSSYVNTLLRSSDYLFRIGGEEFIVLLPETSQKKQ